MAAATMFSVKLWLTLFFSACYAVTPVARFYINASATATYVIFGQASVIDDNRLTFTAAHLACQGLVGGTLANLTDSWVPLNNIVTAYALVTNVNAPYSGAKRSCVWGGLVGSLSYLPYPTFAAARSSGTSVNQETIRQGISSCGAICSTVSSFLFEDVYGIYQRDCDSEAQVRWQRS